MNDIIKYLIQYFLFPTSFIAMITWLIKVLVTKSIEHSYSVALENIRQEYRLELERNKAKYNNLHKLRIAPLLKLYSSIAKMVSHACHLLNLSKFESEINTLDIDELNSLIRAAQDKYNSALLYLPDTVETLTSNIIRNVHDAELEYYVELHGRCGNHEKALQFLMAALNQDINNDLKQLATHIKDMLGVESDSSISGVNHGFV